nr:MULTISPECIES: hypothetical protein [unclassified Streptomyces]
MAYPMPVVKAGGTAEVRPQELYGAETDPFLSTTARLTAAVPIQVVSDGRYILVFRQSIAAGDADMVYRTKGNALTGDTSRTDLVTVGGAKAAAADASLPCDRYALVRSALKPAGGNDTLGTRDMDGKQFYEPTTRLSFLPRLTDGGFAVLLLPTEVEGVSRRQLFVNNAAEKRIESFNCERTDDGLFDVAGTQLWTSPDPGSASPCWNANPAPTPTPDGPWSPSPPPPTGPAPRCASPPAPRPKYGSAPTPFPRRAAAPPSKRG